MQKVMQIFVGKYLRGSPYIQNILLPERIIPEVTSREGAWNIETFPSTGDLCRCCNWI